MSTPFPAGTRVRLISREGVFRYNETGVVLPKTSRSTMILVKFDLDRDRGHSGEGQDSSNNSRFCYPCNLEVVAAAPAPDSPRLKVGDKVKILGNSNSHNFRIGQIVTITDVGMRSYRACGVNGTTWYVVSKDVEVVPAATATDTATPVVAPTTPEAKLLAAVKDRFTALPTAYSARSSTQDAEYDMLKDLLTIAGLKVSTKTVTTTEIAPA